LELGDAKVMVTGAAGFIGSHLAEKLLELGSHVIAYDNFDDFYKGKEQNIKTAQTNRRYKLFRKDIVDYEALKSAMEGADVVIHEAAKPGIRYSIKNPVEAHRVNATGTLNVLMAAKQCGVRKVVYASSSSIFGQPQHLPMNEEHPTNPNSPYGATKLAAEKYCQAFQEVYDIPVTSLRYFSVYGPRGRPDQVIYAFTENLTKDQPPTIYGDGTQTRDFTYVSDVVEATILAAQSEEADGEVFNIGYGSEIDINTLAEKITKALEKEDKPQPIYMSSYRGEFPRTWADNSKARRMLGWKPRTDIDQGLASFIDWYTHRKQK